MFAIVLEQSPHPRLVMREVDDPVPGPGDLLVTVRAVSLNRGEVRFALDGAPAGHRPGWDFAGIVETAPPEAAFRAGDRVFGLLPRGAWAERLAVAPARVAAIPPGVSFVQAAALPVAGLTAALTLAKRGDIAGRSVLVTGATGGVGLLAVQLAARAGGRVTALVRDHRHADLLYRLGARHVVPDAIAAGGSAPFDLAIDAVGGEVLGAILGMLAPQGMCVLCGDAGGPSTTFDGGAFRQNGGTTLYGFFLGDELTRTVPNGPLDRLVARVADGTLDPMIEVERPWTDIDETARGLLDRRFIGKAVLTVGTTPAG